MTAALRSADAVRMRLGVRAVLGLLLALGAIVPAFAQASGGMSPEAMAWAADTHFTLTSSHGAKVTDRDYRGRFLLLQVARGRCAQACQDRSAEVRRAVDALG
ncbi:MAG: SCO family protein, partial [Caulobacteraceae bacterium]